MWPALLATNAVACGHLNWAVTGAVVYWTAYHGALKIPVCTDACQHCLLPGCALAILMRSASFRALIQRNAPKELPLLLAVPLLLNLAHTDVLPTLLSSALFTAILVRNLPSKRDGLRVFNLRLHLVGVISYSLYVWQQLFLLHPVGAEPLGLLSRLPVNLLCVFAVASLSYYLLERPLIALGKRFSLRKERGVRLPRSCSFFSRAISAMELSRASTN